MQNLIKKIYYDNYTVYGARRIFEILRNKGYRVSYKIIYDFCHSLNLVSVDERVKVYHKIKLDIKGFKIKKQVINLGTGYIIGDLGTPFGRMVSAPTRLEKALFFCYFSYMPI